MPPMGGSFSRDSSPVTRASIITWVLAAAAPRPAAEADPCRVLVDVRDHGRKVVVTLEHPRFEAALEEVAGAGIAAVEQHRVDAVQPLHPARELRLGRLDEEVEVVVEQIPRVHLPAEPLGDVHQELEPRFPIPVVEDDRPLLDAAADHVVPGRARQLAPRHPRHVPTLARRPLPRNRHEGTSLRDSPLDTFLVDAGRADWRLMRELLDYRSEFPILEHTTYLINHSLGAMPAAAEERVAEYARTWRERGIRAWGEGWWTMPMTVGDQVGRIVGGAPGTTVM